MRTRVFLLMCLSASATFAQPRAPRPMAAPPGLEDAPDPMARPTISTINKDQVPANTPSDQSPIIFDSPTVSVAQLSIPPKAAKELQRSQKALEAGDVRESLRHFQRAQEIYPDIPYAHNSLGVRYARLYEFPRALSEFQFAAASNPEAAQILHNLGATYYSLHRFSEAEATMRRALDIDPNRLASTFILANSLVMQGRFTTETEQLLRKCSPTYPSSRFLLAKLFLAEGHTEAARTELSAYLKTPHPEHKEDAARMLAGLRVPQSTNASSED
jgi:tetratricopeptide (TPR) repeat protein